MSEFKSITFNTPLVSEAMVSDNVFGVNALAETNTMITGDVRPGFESAINELGITLLRFPGGTMEVQNDLMAETSGNRLSPTLVDFMNWVKEQNENGTPIQVTIGITAKRVITYDEVYNFTSLLMKYYGDYVSGIEIGNEYSILPEVINETLYGQRADVAVRAIDAAFRDHGLSAEDQPDILIQMAETFGIGSDYKGTMNHLDANRDIVSQLSNTTLNAVDGVIAHYYYVEDHDGDENFATPGDWAQINHETRFLYDKTEAWDQAWSERTNLADLDLHITEWNIQKDNFDQQGLKAAGTLLNQFTYMIDMGATSAFIWPLQHKTGNALAGNFELNTAQVAPAGALFGLMNDSLGQSEDDPMQLLNLSNTSWADGLDVNGFQNSEKTVLYISSRTEDTVNLTLDVRNFAAHINTFNAIIVGIDTTTSDGLSEMANDDGLNRLSKRVISYDDYQQYKTLAFFNENNRKHITITTDDGGNLIYKTYLPTFDDIIPITDDPQSISDYRFVSENDVSAELEFLGQNTLGTAADLTLTLDPYEVAQITLWHGTDDAAPYQMNGLWGSVMLSTATFGLDIAALAPQLSTPQSGAELSDSYHNNLSNIIQGTQGPDMIFSMGGDDKISALGGDDFIDAGSGDDTIDGGAGNDTIFGGDGSDVITGGQGKDVFVFHSDTDAQYDRITDFQAGQDTLAFRDADAGTALGQIKEVTFTETDQGTEIHYKNLTVLVEGLELSDLSWSDLYFA